VEEYENEKGIRERSMKVEYNEITTTQGRRHVGDVY